MAGGSAGTDLKNQLNTLFHVGIVGGLSDSQLLQRFLTTQDGDAEATFTALVQRHGPMVRRVCRQVLGDSHDTEDAFQAAFLVLARKAGSVRNADSVASWLHGVARRVAVRAKADAIRRRAYERRGAALKAEESERGRGEPESWPELHEEISRLPGRYREPVVLFYLEGLTTEAAALRLGCPRGTVLSRLSRARERLRARLARRGLPSVAALTRVAAGSPEAVPECLTATTTALTAAHAVQFTAGPLIAGTIPASILNLTTGVLRTMTLAQLKTASFAVSAAALLGVAGGGVYAFQAREGVPAHRGGKPRIAAVVTTTAIVADDKPLKGDLAKIQGQWSGTSDRPEKGTSVEYTFEGESFWIRFTSTRGDAGGLDGKFKIDEKAKPHRTIDWVDQKGLRGGDYPDIPGIYALMDDDTLKLCTPGINSARPTEFYESTDSRMGQGTIILKRK